MFEGLDLRHLDLAAAGEMRFWGNPRPLRIYGYASHQAALSHAVKRHIDVPIETNGTNEKTWKHIYSAGQSLAPILFAIARESSESSQAARFVSGIHRHWPK
jgi:hypothetical protein